jgi:hypothetical protein
LLCDQCGETLEFQGYCSVCERHWTLAPGTPCPKHDLLLQARAPEPAVGWLGLGLATCGANPAWVTVARFADPLTAEAPRIRLEAEGIPTFLEGARMGSASMYQVATGGVKLQVPDALAADARILLRQTWSPVPTEDEDDDFDDAWEDLAPSAVATWCGLGGTAVLVMLSAPLLLYLLFVVLQRLW